MASVWKHPNSPFWTACFTCLDGRRKKRSTKETNRRKAEKLAERMAKGQFDMNDLVLVRGPQASVLSGALPRQMYRFQRRAAYRVRPPGRSTRWNSPNAAPGITATDIALATASEMTRLQARGGWDPPAAFTR
mgnify:CR=1 FL=1